MRTIREVTLSYPGLSDCEDYLVNVVLPGRGIDPEELGSSIDVKTRKLLAADMYAMVGGMADFTENKLSITYPRAWYDKMARRLYMEGGEPENAELIGGSITIPRGKAGGRW